ncbi:MAG: trigger factor [Proteobacteria bacterium]|jgi:trigger factor|nr:trigger factor [Pseudomonadota bacterium]
MRSTVEKVGTLQRKVNVEIPADKVANEFELAFKGVQKSAHIKGFRPGKAPIATIKTMYGERIKQDVIQNLIQKHWFEAVKEHQLEPISYPEFEFDLIKENSAFSFTANFEIKPEVTLKKYEGLEVEKEKFTFDDSRITQVLENIRAARAELVDVLEDRSAQTGDVAVIDFNGFVDGKPLENGAGKDHHLELGSNSFIEGFEQGITGMKIGGQTTLNLKFPNPYHAADLAGKAVEFKVTLKGLKKRSLPEVTDAFVAQMMGGEQHTLETLKTTIREDITQTETKRIENDFKNRILKKLVQMNPVDTPSSMLQEQKQALMEDMKKKMVEQGMSDQEFEAYAQKWDKDFENSASEMIQSGFLVDAIAKKHDLRWTQADLDSKFQEYAKQTGLPEDRIREFYSRPEQENRITYAITEEKVIEFLLKTAKVKELTAGEIKESQN